MFDCGVWNRASKKFGEDHPRKRNIVGEPSLTVALRRRIDFAEGLGNNLFLFVVYIHQKSPLWETGAVTSRFTRQIHRCFLEGVQPARRASLRQQVQRLRRS